MNLFLQTIFNQAPTFFGIDISDLSIKIVKLQKRKNLLPKLIFFNKYNMEEGIIENGLIKNETALIEILKKIMTSIQNPLIKTKYAVVSMPEQKVFIKIIQLPKLSDIELNQAIKWEAEANIPMSLDEIYLDWQIVPSLEILNHVDVLITAIPKATAESYSYVLKKAGIIPIAFELESQAISRALIKKTKEPVMIIDFGLTRTGFLIYSGEIIKFTSTMPISGNQINKIISEKLDVDIIQAEKIKFKINLTEKQGIEEVKKDILLIVDNLVDKIQETISFYNDYSVHEHESSSKISKIILCGGDSNLIGLVEYISNKLNIKTELGQIFADVSILNQNESLNYATAIGLGLREKFYF